MHAIFESFYKTVMCRFWRAPGPSAPREAMGLCLVGARQWPNVGVFFGFRCCEGPQPSSPGTNIEALISFLEGAGPSAPREALEALFGPYQAMAKCWGLFGFRGCQGAAAFQVKNGHCRFMIRCQESLVDRMLYRLINSHYEPKRSHSHGGSWHCRRNHSSKHCEGAGIRSRKSRAGSTPRSARVLR